MNGPMSVSVTAAPEADFAEIATALGVSPQAVKKSATNESWPYREQTGRGGKKRFFPVTTLPEEIKNALLMHRSHQVAIEPQRPALPPAIQCQSAPVALDSGQLDTEIARDRILGFIDAFSGSVPRAIEHLNAHHFAGTLPGPLVWAYERAWDKKRRDSRLNLNTLNKWKATKKKRGRSAPLKVLPDMSVQPWYALAVACAQRPQGSCKKWIAEQIANQWQPAWGDAPPSYNVVARFFREKFSALDQIKGRYTGSQLRAHKFYQHRTSAGLAPWDEVHADGWNTHFSAPHPVTGEYVTYEVWHAHDVATRFVPPFGVGLTENFEVIAKCVENAVRAGGVMAILQTDSTRIVKNSERFKTNPATAIADRAGFTIVHPKEVGNSQANGIAENFNTWLDKESRELATYQNPNRMDELSFKRVKKITGAMVRAAGRGDVAEMQARKREAERMGKGMVLTSYEQAVAWLEARRQKWNDKPHRSLPKVRDEATGKLRHQTPREALLEHIARGWEPALPEMSDADLEQHLTDLFRPHMQAKVTRGTVSPYGGMRYRHTDLDAWLGKFVVVAYDIMDWHQVWVKTLKGEPICTAEFVAATGYRTLSAQEFAEEKRLQAQIAAGERAMRKKTERLPGRVFEQLQAPVIEQTIADFLPAQPAKKEVEREFGLLDFLPEKQEAAPEPTYMDTVLMLYGTGEKTSKDEDGDAPVKEAAAG